jgi:hypothetical protein
MSKFNRRRAEALEARYKWFHRGDKCYYCGDLADTVDHCPPLDIAYSRGVDDLSANGVALVKVRCCRECNSILGNRSLLTTESRTDYLYQKIVKRYGQYLRTGEWDWEDLAELGPNLRSAIVNSENIRLWAERRLQFMEETFAL